MKSFQELTNFSLPDVPPELVGAHGTTVLAVRFNEGAIIVADRRATMGNLIMYEQAEKIERLDRHTVIAISGAYARSIEVTRFLRHSFKYFERMNLHEMSAESKLMEISRALAQNLGSAQAGTGVFLPIAAAYDPAEDRFGVYFFDLAGARFHHTDHACAGSGSERIRGIFELLSRQHGRWFERPYKDALTDALTMLDIAASLDTATGGFRAALPSVCVLDKSGAKYLKEDEIRAHIVDEREAGKAKSLGAKGKSKC